MSIIQRIDHAITQATHHRDQLHEIARNFVELHEYSPGSCESDELMHVILDGEDYEEALKRVIRLKQRKHRSQ